MRPLLTPWFAWWREISAIPYEVSDPTVADRKLAWWAQTVTAALDARVTTPNDPPLIHALLGTMQRPHAPPLAHWINQIQGIQQLTQQTRWLDTPPLLRHMRMTTGAACEGAAWLAGARDETTLSVAADMGVALRRAHVLFRLGQDTRQGWLHLPIDLLQMHNVKAHELLKPVLGTDGRPAAHVLPLLADWQAQARQALMEVLARDRALDATQRRCLQPLRIIARLYLALLTDVHQAGYPVFAHRLGLGPWRKVWIAQMARWR